VAEHQPHVTGGRWRRRREPAGHPRFDDEPLPGPAGRRGDADEDPLAAALDAADGPADDLSNDGGGPRLDEDRPHGAAGKLGRGDPPAGQEADPAPHRLDFGEFGHRRWVRSRDRDTRSRRDGSTAASGYNLSVRGNRPVPELAGFVRRAAPGCLRQ